MPYFNEDWKHELHSRINIVDLVGGYVDLKSKSGRWWACCPFHNEKTPSFTVNPERGFFHCFGCGKSGNAIDFVMEMEKMSFPEACTYLAEKVNLPLPEQTGGGEYEKKKALRDKIYAMNRIMARYYHQCLVGGDGKPALDYLTGRGLSMNIIKTFGLGYAPAKWDSAVTLLGKEGFTKQEMQAAGLVKMKDTSCFDMFRDRAMMPIINTFGEVIGFGGRVMGDGMPKYLNSPETAAFSKSRNLYNLNIVRKLKSLRHIILVEGYMDVIALYAAGIQGSVATLGTALTSGQARLLKKYSTNIYISYDGDEAGRKAALRATDILAAEGLQCKVITIPGGLDPDDFLKENGKQGYMRLLKDAKPQMEYKLDALAAEFDLEDGYAKEQYAKRAVLLLKKLDSAMLQEKYAELLSARTGFSRESILKDITDGKPSESRQVWKKPANEQKDDTPLLVENKLMAFLCAYPQQIEAVSENPGEGGLMGATNKKVFSYILTEVKKGVLPSGGEILSVPETEEEKSHITHLLETDMGMYSENAEKNRFLSDCVRKIEIRNKEEKRKELLKVHGETADEGQKALLMKELNALQQEIYDLRTGF